MNEELLGIKGYGRSRCRYAGGIIEHCLEIVPKMRYRMAATPRYIPSRIRRGVKARRRAHIWGRPPSRFPMNMTESLLTKTSPVSVKTTSESGSSSRMAAGTTF